MATPITLGILAHVDAGKTTLSEQLLYHAGAIRAAGRVDHGNTALDVDEIERERGITVFSDQAWFELTVLAARLSIRPDTSISWPRRNARCRRWIWRCC